MKIAIVAFSLFLSTFASASFDLVEKMLGQYTSVDANCAYDSASLRVSRMDGNRILQIRLQNSNTRAFNIHSIDLDNLWTKVKTTRGFQRIIKQDRIQGSTILSEVRDCYPGWIGCSEFVRNAEVTLIDNETIEARLSVDDQSCTFRKI